MGSSTPSTGSGRSPLNSQLKSAHATRSSVGLSSLGSSVKDSGWNRSPHHGQFSRGMGAGRALGFALNWRVLARAESERFSPLLPITLGVAALPTHRPISNGHSP